MNTHHKRVTTEQTIAKMVVTDALNLGYAITVNNGGDEDDLEVSKDWDEIVAALFATNEDTLTFYDADKRVGWVHFIYGNNGYDVINDYLATAAMDALLLRAGNYAESKS